MLLETSVFDNIVKFITDTGKKIGFNWLAVIAFSLLLVTIIISFIATMFSIEAKTAKAVQRINLYLEKNPYISDENLVEFNTLMKKIPAPMRVQWQQYMVGRNQKPSTYFNEENCIEKPFRSSSYSSHVVAVEVITICIAILAFVFSCGSLADSSLLLSSVLLQSALISGFALVLGALYVLFLKSRRNALLYDLYYNFTNFKNYIDRAVTTLPDYVDYEILFTKKEINEGIPVLQEYLKQRAEYEQEQIKKAKESQVEHEQYDFSAIGVDGSVIMEKVMRECEYMLGNKKRVLQEISELQSTLDSYERAYDDKNKNTQRKLRDIQESLDRLREKLSTTTNMIVGNDLRKQRENEIEKQRQAEKEADEDTAKYEKNKADVTAQIEAKKAEIEEYRKNAQDVLIAEFKAYSDKVYATLKDETAQQFQTELDTANSSIAELQEQLEEKERALVEKNTMLSEMGESVQQANKEPAEQTVQDVEQPEESNQDSSEQSELQLAYNNAQMVIEDKSHTIDELQAELEDSKANLDETNKKLAVLNDQIAQKEAKIEKLQIELEAAKEKAVSGEGIAEMQEQLDQANKDLDDLRAQVEMKDIEISAQKTEIEESKSRIAELESQPEQIKYLDAQGRELFKDENGKLYRKKHIDREYLEDTEKYQEEKPSQTANVDKTQETSADELAKQNETLSKQLQSTQEILKAIVAGNTTNQPTVEKPAVTEKASTKRATRAKRATAKKSTKKSTKTKKSPSKKLEKKPANKVTNKKAISKPAKKSKTSSPSLVEEKTSEGETKQNQQPQNEQDASKMTVADLSLEQFNEQLKSAISDIAANDKKDKN